MAAEVQALDVGVGRQLILARGELDLHVAPELRARLTSAVEAGMTSVVVDLSAVEFVDSTVMTVLLRQAKVLSQHGGSLALVGLRGHVERVFEITGLDRALPQFPSQEAAFAAEAAPQ